MSPNVCGIHLRLASSDEAPVSERLRRALGSRVEITSGDRVPPRTRCLLLAPHEVATAEQTAILRRHAWSWVHLTTAGYDFFRLCDAPANAWVTRSWRAYAAPIAEYALRALLRHAWDVEGTGLCGRRVGVVGYGEVGRRIVQVLCALEARVIVLRRRVEAIPGVECTSDLGDLLALQALVLAAPLNETSAGLISRAFLHACASGLHLVNVARGELVDHDALADAVRGRELHATLDVTSPEPLPLAHPLLRESRVRITHHVAWRSGTDDHRYLDDFLENWRAFELGREPLGQLHAPAQELAAP